MSLPGMCYWVLLLTALMATHNVVFAVVEEEVDFGPLHPGLPSALPGRYHGYSVEGDTVCGEVDGVPFYIHGHKCYLTNDFAVTSFLDHIKPNTSLSNARGKSKGSVKLSSCPVGEHRCYTPNVRTSVISPDQCTGGFRSDSDNGESIPDVEAPENLWSLSSYLLDHTWPWWNTRSDYLPLSNSGCEQLGYQTSHESLVFDWKKLYVWFKPDGCWYARSAGSGLRLQCMKHDGVPVPMLFFWHLSPVFVAVEAPNGLTSISTISRIGIENSCGWAWTLVELNVDCGPYASLLRSSDCQHSFCVFRPK